MREIADEKEGELYSSDIIEALCKEFGVCENKSSYGVDLCNCLKAIADEIEKFYIPRPRFEDGEPVQFGDEYKWADANIRKITGFGVTENGAPYVTCAFDGLGMSDAMIYSGSLKRPKPKVLDADGVPIEEDDTVYGMGRKQHRYTVQIPYSVDNEDGERFCVQCYDHDDGIIAWCDPSMLTHREPDSMEKVRDDIAEWRADVAIPGNGWDIKTAEWCDRLTAIMERDA